MKTLDFTYLRRIADRADPVAILREPKFLDAQKLFFAVVEELGGGVDFDIADMREVHAVAALGDVQGKRVLDVGCGSTEPYVLEDTFRDRYPPFFAEMLGKRGAVVTGVDIRPNAGAHYEHRVLDCTKGDWAQSLMPPYDIVACLSLFNAPGSPFEQSEELCDRLLVDMRGLLAKDGILILTLRDDLVARASQDDMRAYAEANGFSVLHLDGNCAWLKRV